MPNIFKYIALIGVVLIVSQSAFAQQNIINVPSSDVLPAGNIILKQSNKFSPLDNSYVSLTPSVIMGVGKGVEASVGVGTTISENNSTKMNIGVKKVFKYKKATRFTVGGTLSPNLTEGRILIVCCMLILLICVRKQERLLLRVGLLVEDKKCLHLLGLCWVSTKRLFQIN